MNVQPLLVLLLILAGALYGAYAAGDGYRKRLDDEARRQDYQRRFEECERGQYGPAGPSVPCPRAHN